MYYIICASKLPSAVAAVTGWRASQPAICCPRLCMGGVRARERQRLLRVAGIARFPAKIRFYVQSAVVVVRARARSPDFRTVVTRVCYDKIIFR